ncbi:MAG: hypothetical protein ACT4QD_11175 [Acidobacteriota bacterium]
MAINRGKVVAGGLVAGLVFNIGDFLINAVFMVAENEQLMTRLGLDPAAMTSIGGMLPWIVIDFIFGVLVVWTYAAIRPRFGPGPRTAISAGLIPFIAATLIIAGLTSMGLFATTAFLKGTALSLVNVVIGSVAGAWVYTEA